MNRGKAVIFGMFALAVIAAGTAWWTQYAKGRQALVFWGADAAWLIRQGDAVELWVFAPPISAENASSAFDETSISLRHDLSHAHGVVHARQALIVDASYVWPPKLERSGETTQWRYALAFSREGQRAIVLFDLKRGRTKLASGSEEVTLGEILRTGLQIFFDEAVGPQPAQPASAGNTTPR